MASGVRDEVARVESERGRKSNKRTLGGVRDSASLAEPQLLCISKIFTRRSYYKDEKQ